MAIPFACDRCLKPVLLSPSGAGELVRPQISLRMPHNPTNGMSEGLDFSLCGDCYELTRQFMGLQPNPSLTDGWKAREVSRARQLPTLTYKRSLRGAATQKGQENDDR